MPELNIGALRAVAAVLDKTRLVYAFTGGSIVNLLLDDPEFSPVRPTDDVDVIIEAVASSRYSDVEEMLRGYGFNHDVSVGAPRCRWILGKFTVDIMPTQGDQLGLNTTWFKEVLACSIVKEYAHTSFRIVSPIGFLVTKYIAFIDRGNEDYYASHDIEDFVTIIDGRKNIVAEVNAAPVDLKRYLVTAISHLCSEPKFIEALPGYLQADPASQQRLPLLRLKLRRISELARE